MSRDNRKSVPNFVQWLVPNLSHFSFFVENPFFQLCNVNSFFFFFCCVFGLKPLSCRPLYKYEKISTKCKIQNFQYYLPQNKEVLIRLIRPDELHAQLHAQAISPNIACACIYSANQNIIMSISK
jgi:hypothetical protein